MSSIPIRERIKWVSHSSLTSPNRNLQRPTSLPSPPKYPPSSHPLAPPSPPPPSIGEIVRSPPSRTKVNAVHVGPSPLLESSKVSSPRTVSFPPSPNNNSSIVLVSSMEILVAMEVCLPVPSTTLRLRDQPPKLPTPTRLSRDHALFPRENTPSQDMLQSLPVMKVKDLF